MLSPEKIKALTVDDINQLLEKATKPRDLKAVNRAFEYMEIASIGHFIILSSQDIQEIESNPSKFWQGSFARHLETHCKKVGDSFNPILLIKFIISIILIKRLDRIIIQLYSYFIFSKDVEYNKAADYMYENQKKTSAFNNDYTVLKRMEEINYSIRKFHSSERKIQSVILEQNNVEFEPLNKNQDFFKEDTNSTNNGIFYIFKTERNYLEITKLVNLLIQHGFSSVMYKDKFISMFLVKELEKHQQFNSVLWLGASPTLVYLFYCLIDFNVIESADLIEVYSRLSCNFKDTSDESIKANTLSTAARRMRKKGLKNSTEGLELFAKKEAGEYNTIYEILFTVFPKSKSN